MRYPRLTIAAILAAWLAPSPPFAAGEARQSSDPTVPVPPRPVAIDGRDWLACELHLTHFSTEPIRLDRVEVISDGTDILADAE